MSIFDTPLIITGGWPPPTPSQMYTIVQLPYATVTTNDLTYVDAILLGEQRRYIIKLLRRRAASLGEGRPAYWYCETKREWVIKP